MPLDYEWLEESVANRDDAEALADKLREMSNDGWEVVNMVPIPNSSPGFYRVLLKRQRR
jgi:hypothetical protein